MSDSLKELVNGFSVKHPIRLETVYTVVYRISTGEIVNVTVDPIDVSNGLEKLVIDKSAYEIADLIPNYKVRKNKLVSIKQRRYTECILELSETGQFITTKNNMLFIADIGDRYDYRDS